MAQRRLAGTEDLLIKLRRICRIGCLSNSNALHRARFGGLLGHFDIALSSHLLGAIKPDLACVMRALRECEVEALNVEAARDLGMTAFHVNGLDDVRLTLEAHGMM